MRILLLRWIYRFLRFFYFSIFFLIFFVKKPKVIQLRIFGCPVYIHVPKEKRKNLDPSRKKGIFVGYSESLKAYRIYFLGFKKIYISRDVTFDEDSTYIKSRRNLLKNLKK